MPDAEQPTRDFKGDNLSVKMFGAVDDWDATTETGTDNTDAIQAALDTLTTGQTLYFPAGGAGGTGKYLITRPLIIPRGASGAKGVTLRGSGKLHAQLLFMGDAEYPCVINMIGCDSVTWKDIAVLAWSDDIAKMPKTVLMLGRYPDTDAYGHHNFSRVSFMGNVKNSVVYSIASEENSWHGCFLFANNGKGFAGRARHVYYTSYKDDLAICDPAITVESNLDIWFAHCHFLNFAPGHSDNDCVYEQMGAGCGDHVYRDCYLSPSARGETLGWCFRFVASPTEPYSGSNFVVEANRFENGEGMFRLEKGVGDGIITGLRFAKNTAGIQAGYLIYGEDDAVIAESTWESNFPPAPPGDVDISIDKCTRLWVREDYDCDFIVRTIATQSQFLLSSTQATISLGGASFNNLIVLHDKITMPGPIQGPVQVSGTLEVDATGLGGVTYLIKDASGTTTGKVIEFRTNAGTPYFAVYMGTDATFPGFVQTHDILPISNLTHDLGNPGLLWKKIWAQDLLLSGLTASGPLIGVSGLVGYGHVDLSSASHVTGSGLSSGALVAWDGSTLVSVSDGISGSITVVIAVSAASVDSFVRAAGGNANAITSLGVTTLGMNFTHGRYMS
jgi:hypothetical protein